MTTRKPMDEEIRRVADHLWDKYLSDQTDGHQKTQAHGAIAQALSWVLTGKLSEVIGAAVSEINEQQDIAMINLIMQMTARLTPLYGGIQMSSRLSFYQRQPEWAELTSGKHHDSLRRYNKRAEAGELNAVATEFYKRAYAESALTRDIQ